MKINRSLFWLLLAACLLLVSLTYNPPQFIEGDLPVWLNDYRSLNSCLSSGLNCNQISRFPVAYLFASLTIKSLGDLIHLRPSYALLAVNTIGLISTFLLVKVWHDRHLSRQPSSNIMLLLAFIFSPLLPFYFYSGFLEPISGFILAISLVSLYLFTRLNGKDAHQCLAIYSASLFIYLLFKDTYIITYSASLFLAILSFSRKSEFYGSIIQGRKIRGLVASTSLTALAALSLTSFYNYIKYRSILPSEYLAQSLSVSTSVSFKLESLLAILLSPQGGLIAFWLCSVLIISSSAYYKRSPLLLPVRIAVFNLIFTAAVSTLWWAPFGWDSWGNRLMIPAVIPLLVLPSLALNRNNSRPCFGNFLALPPLLKLLITISISYSAYYLICSYSPWGRIELMRSQLYGPQSCQHYIQRLRDSTDNEYPIQLYEACASDRYWSFPKLVLPKVQSSMTSY